MLARFAQGVAQLLVLRRGLSELALGLEQPFLELAQPLGRFGQLAAQVPHLFFEQHHLRPELGLDVVTLVGHVLLLPTPDGEPTLLLVTGA